MLLKRILSPSPRRSTSLRKRFRYFDCLNSLFLKGTWISLASAVIVTLPHLASLLRHGTPIPIHGGEGSLLTVSMPKDSQITGRTIAEVFEQFPELLAVAIIRDHKIQLPRGATRLEGGDQLLIAASGTTSVEAFKRFVSNSLGNRLISPNVCCKPGGR
jgi:NhaP-type Na+/H+ and K+/H+ antiporter